MKAAVITIARANQRRRSAAEPVLPATEPVLSAAEPVLPARVSVEVME
jgi:hypothetical protein